MTDTTTIHRALCEAAESLTNEAGYCASNASLCEAVGLEKIARFFHSHRKTLRTTASLLRQLSIDLTDSVLDAASESHSSVLAQIDEYIQATSQDHQIEEAARACARYVHNAQLRAGDQSIWSSIDGWNPFEVEIRKALGCDNDELTAWLKSEITPESIQRLGWSNNDPSAEWQRWISPDSQPRGGPVCHLEWEPLGGCDGWSVNGRELIGPFETVADVVAIMRALKISEVSV